MNNNKLLLAGLAVVVVVLAGVVFLGTKGNNTANPVTQNQTTQKQNPTPAKTIEGKEVTVTNTGFELQTITIKAGQRVVWTNKSGASVTVNSDSHPTHLLWPFLNLGQFVDGSSVSVVFEKAGKYTYHNHLNPSQTGTVIVE